MAETNFTGLTLLFSIGMEYAYIDCESNFKYEVFKGACIRVGKLAKCLAGTDPARRTNSS